MNVVQGQISTHACSISQAASVAALNGPTDFFAERAASFQARRDIVVGAISDASGLSCLSPEGAFYVFPDLSGIIGKVTPNGQLITSDTVFCTWLLEEWFVSAVPGATFGLSPYMRISTAASEADLREACRRIVAAFEQLEAPT